MNCPYCAEEIKDAAIVCRYCQRDLAFFQHFINRIATLETTVAELEQAIAKGFAAAQPKAALEAHSAAMPSLKPISSILILSAIFGGVVEFLVFWRANSTTSSPEDMTLGIFGLCTPILLLIYLAVSNRYSRVLDYVWFGLSQGAAVGVALVLSPTRWGGFRFQLDQLTGGAFIGAGIYGLMYLTVGLFRRIFNRRKKAFSPTDLPAKVAFNMIGRPSAVPPGSLVENRWKRVSDLIAALAPVLTLLGSIVAAYFGYLGAIAKATAAK